MTRRLLSAALLCVGVVGVGLSLSMSLAIMTMTLSSRGFASL